MLFCALIAGMLALALSGPAFAADPRRDEQWGLAMVKAEAAWSTSTGVGAVVAVIDTGVQPNHPDLGGRLQENGFDYVGDDRDPADGDGHGTHVTGIIAANRDNGEGITGVAPGARVLPLRVLGDNGGETGDVADAIDYAIDAGAHVINLSLGDDPILSELDEDPRYGQALERAVARGIVVVLAAGNSTLPQCENPEVAEALCVGSVDRRGMRSVFSSFGMNVDLMAPGGSLAGGSAEDVLSTYFRSRYETLAGTSQAAPHVSGVAALLVSLGVGGQQAVDRILATAAPGGPDLAAGIVDAAAAVEGLAPPPPPPDGDPNPAAGSFSTKSPVRRSAIRRRGFRVTCRAARPGPCRVTVTRRGRRIARGRADVPTAIRTVVSAALNRRGRRTLKRMGRRIRVRVAVTLPGESARTRRVTVKR